MGIVPDSIPVSVPRQEVPRRAEVGAAGGAAPSCHDNYDNSIRNVISTTI